MTTLHVEDRVAAILKAQAAAKGLTLDAYLNTIAQAQPAKDPETVKPDDADTFDAALDELFAADTRPLANVSIPYSRRDIYIDHD